jgi:uncharacterized protein (TIGR02466 family)
MEFTRKDLYPTPIWTTKVKGYSILNQKLEKFIYSLQKKDPIGRKSSEVGGYYSPDLRNGSTEIQPLLDAIAPHITRAFTDLGVDIENYPPIINSIWSIINSENSYMNSHIHPESYLSMGYYVKVPQGDCGNFVMEDPRLGAQFKIPPTKHRNNLNLRKVELPPEEGLLVIFQSFVPHFVKPNRTNKDRIVISANFGISSAE